LKILLNKQTYLEELNEFKSEWVFYVLSLLSIDLDLFSSMTIDNQRKLLEKNNISITDYPSLNAIKIEKVIDNSVETVAEFIVSSLTLKTDSERKETYYEVEIEEWNMFE